MASVMIGSCDPGGAKLKRNPLVLTIDCGTQSMRAMLFDQNGVVVDVAQEKFVPYFSNKPGWAEQHPEFYYQKLCDAAGKLRQRRSDRWNDIIAVTITAFRDSFVNLDKDMKPLRPCFLWLDRRTAACEERLPLLNEAAFRAVGMRDTIQASRKACRSNWIIENQPEIWAKTEKFLMLSGYLSYRLTGNVVDSVAAQAGHVPFDYKNKKWMSRSNIKSCVFNIPKEMLPDLVEPGDVLGTLSAQAAAGTGLPAGLPVIATGSDKSCETVGCGAVSPNMANISYGSAATVQITTSRYVEPQPFLPAYPAIYPNRYNPEVQVYRGYWMLAWFAEQFAPEEQALAEEQGVYPEEILEHLLKETPPGADGLLLQPYWGPGLENPEARGGVIGFTDVHTRAHVYRAIIEGVGYALCEALDKLSVRAHCDVTTLTVSGGGSRSDAICQITADLFGRTVRRIQTSEAAGLGSSIAGFVGMGEFSGFDEAIDAMVHYGSSFRPSSAHHAVYNKYFELYKKLYPSLRSLYRQMRDSV